MQPKTQHVTTRPLTLAVAALCLAVAGMAAAHAATIGLVDANFNTLYKPGSTTVTATAFNDNWGWTSSVGTGVTISDGKYALLTDSTTSTTLDIPGWVSTGACTGIMQVGASEFRAYSNGDEYGFNGGTLSQTVAGVTAQANSVYTLSAEVAGNVKAMELTYQLWFGTTQITAITAATTTPGDLAVFSVKFQVPATAPSGDLKVVFAFAAKGTQAQIDNVVLSVPEPAALSLLGLGALGCLGRGRRRG